MDRSIAFYVSRFRRGTAAPVIRLSSGGFGDTFGGRGDDISRQGCRHLMFLLFAALCVMVHPARGEKMLLLLQHSPKSELVVADVDFQAVVQRSGIDPRQLPRVQAFSLSDDTPLPIQFVPELTFDPGTAILPAAPEAR